MLTTLLVVAVFGYFASLYARGYRFNFKTYSFQPSGVLVLKSDPDGASIYINGDLSGATNSNLNLAPGSYDVEIKKEGFTSWSKRLIIQKEEVTQVTANIFRIAPSLSPITFDGATLPTPSSDYSKIAYVNEKGLWVMETSILPIGFSNDPKRITDGDLTGAKFHFSPNGQELLLESEVGTYLLATDSFISQSDRVNVGARKTIIEKEWETEKKVKDTRLINSLLPIMMADVISNRSSDYHFSPDESMVLYSASSSASIANDLIKQLPGSSTQKQERDIIQGKNYIYDIKEDRNFLVGTDQDSLYWLPTSRHLISAQEGSITIMDYDGTNRQKVFSGGYIFPYAFPFVNSSRLLILTNLGSDSAVTNLYSLSVK